MIDNQLDSITLMFANGKTAVSGTFQPAEEPADIEFTVSVPSNKWTKEDLTMDEFYSQIRVEGLNDTADKYGSTTFAGEIVNDTEGDYTLSRINIVLRDTDGAIVGGYFTYANSDLTAGSSQPFSVSTLGDTPEYATVEAYVDCGYPISQ